MSNLSATTIASYSLQPPTGAEIEVAQAAHRIRLVELWDIKPGQKILELGCGQGNTTAVLAEAIGTAGKVDAVDPADPDYGAPFTLAQAQKHISDSAVGDRVAWHRALPEEFLKATEMTWDVAILAHCIWYFESAETLRQILAALKGRVAKVCIAEYALHATEKAAIPHVLAAIARGTLESLRPDSTENIRSPLSPKAILELASETGWKKQHENNVVPDIGLLDGQWEVGSVTSKTFTKEVEKAIENDRLKLVIESARQATVVAVEALKGAKVGTMDVWVASLSTGA